MGVAGGSWTGVKRGVLGEVRGAGGGQKGTYILHMSLEHILLASRGAKEEVGIDFN